MPDEKLLTTQEVADVLRVSRQHVRNLCREGRLKSLRVGKKSIRVKENELRRFLEAGSNG